MRCCNLDWLEVYCEEDPTVSPCDAAYYERSGYHVHVRDYGTRQYKEMFTVLDKDDNGFVEIRRNPVSGDAAERIRGIFSPFSCHIRLVNRWCYHPDCVNLFTEFLNRHHYNIIRIFRLDICLDFELFDKGDEPRKFIQRYMSGRYSKINQSNLSAHGRDQWDGRTWNSLSWGAEKSMVGTKIYNKTQELRDVKDKPYIRYAWFQSGLVDDFTDCTKHDADGNVYHPDIWRVEFSIKSTARMWYVYEDNNGRKRKVERKPHSLHEYATPDQRLEAFNFLQHHYFHFKKYQDGVRKDRCEDKVLFDFGQDHTVMYLDRLLTDAPASKSANALRRRLEMYRYTHADEAIRKACSLLIDTLCKEQIRDALPTWDVNEARLLQLIIARRINQHPDETVGQSIDVVKAMYDLEQSLF